MLKRIVIVEDEAVAAQNLLRLLSDILPDVKVEAILQGVEDSVEWFHQHPAPDVVFMDIHLADGLAFTMFDSVRIDAPIIFTTAYDQYALQAFDVNGIAYLLKPINRDALMHAVEKLEMLRTTDTPDSVREARFQKMLDMIQKQSKSYQSYFLIPWRDRLIPLPVSNIACFCVADRGTKAFTLDGRQFDMDDPLEVIMKQLDPVRFFRANRQYIISREAVRDIVVWFGGKLQLTLSIATPEPVIVSRANAHEFKTWYIR